MTFNSRYSVLFPEAEDIGSHIQFNDTHLQIKGDKGVMIQNRLSGEYGSTIDNYGGHITRITWKSSKANQKCLNQSIIIEPILSPGLNIYTTSSQESDQIFLIETPVYNSHHSHIFSDLKNWLPPGLNSSLIKWNNISCDYDINLSNGSFEINEWCPLNDGKVLELEKHESQNKLEIGLFYLDFQDDKDINLAGLRCSWDTKGFIEKFQKTMLMYMPAHFLHDDYAPLELETPVGLHPKLLIDLQNSTLSNTKCDYFAYFQLPKHLFVDKFQETPICLFGEQDLEQPEYKLQGWGSESLFRLEPGKLNEITLHTRYVLPAVAQDRKSVNFDVTVFTACDTGNDEVAKNPFYSKGLGYEAFFTSDTVFRHLNSTSIEVYIPSPDISHYKSTQYLTLGCLILSMIYLFSKIFTPRN